MDMMGDYADRSRKSTPEELANKIKNVSLINAGPTGIAEDAYGIENVTGFRRVGAYDYVVSFQGFEEPSLVYKIDHVNLFIADVGEIHPAAFNIATDGIHLWIGDADGNVYAYNTKLQWAGYSLSLPEASFNIFDIVGENLLVKEAFVPASVSPYQFVDMQGNEVKTLNVSNGLIADFGIPTALTTVNDNTVLVNDNEFDFIFTFDLPSEDEGESIGLVELLGNDLETYSMDIASSLLYVTSFNEGAYVDPVELYLPNVFVDGSSLPAMVSTSNSDTLAIPVYVNNLYLPSSGSFKSTVV
jgi:hypothetical protein